MPILGCPTIPSKHKRLLLQGVGIRCRNTLSQLGPNSCVLLSHQFSQDIFAVESGKMANSYSSNNHRQTLMETANAQEMTALGRTMKIGYAPDFFEDGIQLLLPILSRRLAQSVLHKPGGLRDAICSDHPDLTVVMNEHARPLIYPAYHTVSANTARRSSPCDRHHAIVSITSTANTFRAYAGTTMTTSAVPVSRGGGNTPLCCETAQSCLTIFRVHRLCTRAPAKA